MERYFFVAYTYMVNGVFVNANSDVITKGNSFFNRKQFIEYLKDKQMYDDIVITNIIEITESDYNDYNR